MLDVNAIPASFYMVYCNGHWQLNTNHAYYYQVKCQMRVWDLPFYDFVVWCQSGLVIQRIEIARSF